MLKTLPMPRHIIASLVLAIASIACAPPSASVVFDTESLKAAHADTGLSHQEREWLALGRPEDHVNVDSLGLGAPTAASLITDGVDFGARSMPGPDNIANKQNPTITLCRNNGQCTDENDFGVDWDAGQP